MNWCGVLVSVRDAAEAVEALSGGAAIIDVKEPRNGSLGAAAPATVAEVAAAVGGPTPWTMACGELSAGVAAVQGQVQRVLELLPSGALPPAAIKVGLAGMAGRPWRDGLVLLQDGLPDRTGQVAVAYADWDRVAAPSPEDVIEAAAACGCFALLIDTFDKAAPGLLTLRPAAQVAAWVAEARHRGLVVAVAGKVTLAQIPPLQACGGPIVALRSAVCFNGLQGMGRLGTVQSHLVREAVAIHAAAASADLSVNCGETHR